MWDGRQDRVGVKALGYPPGMGACLGQRRPVSLGRLHFKGCPLQREGKNSSLGRKVLRNRLAISQHCT